MVLLNLAIKLWGKKTLDGRSAGLGIVVKPCLGGTRWLVNMLYGFLL